MVVEKALSGLRVVEWGYLVSAPYCTKLMADLGAEVIKIEHPDFPDESRKYGPFLDDIPEPERSGLFLYLNTNKMGITLNLETTTGRDMLMRILKDTDIFVENNPVQRMKDLGLGYTSIKEINQSLIMTSITPFGQTGPYNAYKAYDINTQAAGGTTWVTGFPDREPLALPLSQSGYQAGICGAISSLMALWAREAIGRGQHIDISEAEVWATVHWGFDMLWSIFSWGDNSRWGHHVRGFRYPACIIPCKDGHVCLQVAEAQQWRKFLNIMGENADDVRFKEWHERHTYCIEEADAVLRPWAMEHTREEILALGLENDLPWAPVKNCDEVVDDPHLAARGFWGDIGGGEIGVQCPLAGYHLSKTPARIDHRAPRLGEHNKLIYCDRLGYSKQELTTLRRSGII